MVRNSAAYQVIRIMTGVGPKMETKLCLLSKKATGYRYVVNQAEAIEELTRPILDVDEPENSVKKRGTGRRDKRKRTIYFDWTSSSIKRGQDCITSVKNKSTQLPLIHGGENVIYTVPQYKINRRT